MMAGDGFPEARDIFAPNIYRYRDVESQTTATAEEIDAQFVRHEPTFAEVTGRLSRPAEYPRFGPADGALPPRFELEEGGNVVYFRAGMTGRVRMDWYQDIAVHGEATYRARTSGHVVRPVTVQVVNESGDEIARAFGEPVEFDAELGRRYAVVLVPQTDLIDQLLGSTIAELSDDLTSTFAIRQTADDADTLTDRIFIPENSPPPGSRTLFEVSIAPADDRQALARFVLDNSTNILRPADVNLDGRVDPLDALQLLNVLRYVGGRTERFFGPSSNRPDSRFTDVNGDGAASLVDALIIVNRLTGHRSDAAPAFDTAPGVNNPTFDRATTRVLDQIFADVEDDLPLWAVAVG